MSKLNNLLSLIEEEMKWLERQANKSTGLPLQYLEARIKENTSTIKQIRNVK